MLFAAQFVSFGGRRESGMRILLIVMAVVMAANGAHADEFRIGPGGERVRVQVEYYVDQHHHRHAFEVPEDWRDYPHPLGWYRVHRQWWRASDWYRRENRGIDAATRQSEIQG